ncbi:DNA-binding response regulator [Variovorax beijingensis]|uniref:DNA-binding response regulator n=1 Tax=Variovorax beijingensis TaxID=2496117 RepID=A0A3P3EKB3_9BURK|nr:response regulator transcription factor [Variovorax beijingensis]RRH86232.1 DNA-binding response regulator [Variovorax beijingensis]RSZ33942.1 response regulator transcription factor [Variovorax beijingensis]
MLKPMNIEATDTGKTHRWGVLVVEDDSRARAFFEASVQRSGSLFWLGSAGTVHEALAWMAQTTIIPDVLLVDLGMPDGSGLDVIREAVARFPGCEPLVISVFGDEENVLASIEAGAVGYIHKDAAPEDIAQTIVEMKAGASPISPMIARRVLAKYRSLQLAGTLAAAPPEAALGNTTTAPSLLSAREHEVLTLIARGFSYAEIARLKGLSVHTVQTHIKNLYGKLAVHSKSEAVFEATRLGLLSHPG